jgi:hypothetical protein
MLTLVGIGTTMAQMKPLYRMSAFYGALCSAVLTLFIVGVPGLGFYVSLWIGLPGWILAWATVIVLRMQPDDHRILGIALIGVGNAGFYALCWWFLLRKAYRKLS